LALSGLAVFSASALRAFRRASPINRTSPSKSSRDENIAARGLLLAGTKNPGHQTASI
jgi:hypothetical protein